MPITVKFIEPIRSSQTSIASSTTSQVILQPNAVRRGAGFYNDSTGNLLLSFGPSASTTLFTVKLAAISGSIGGYYELPFPIYRGVITGIWDAANGFCRVTELF